MNAGPLAPGRWCWLFLPALDKHALSMGRHHPEAQLGKTIQLGSDLRKMPTAFCFRKDPDCTHNAQARSGGPRAGRAVVEDHQGIRESARQIECAALARPAPGIIVHGRRVTDFDPGLVHVWDVTSKHPAPIKLLFHLRGHDELAEEVMQEIKPSQPMKVEQRRRVGDDFSHGSIAACPARESDLPGSAGRR
jgi:hypothetical protein